MSIASNKLAEEYQTNGKSPKHHRPSSEDGEEKYFSSKNSPSKLQKQDSSEQSNLSPHLSTDHKEDLKGKFYQDFLEEAEQYENENADGEDKEFMTMTMGNIKVQETQPS
jgi:hypothetical protein